MNPDLWEIHCPIGCPFVEFQEQSDESLHPEFISIISYIPSMYFFFKKCHSPNAKDAKGSLSMVKNGIITWFHVGSSLYLSITIQVKLTYNPPWVHHGILQPNPLAKITMLKGNKKHERTISFQTNMLNYQRLFLLIPNPDQRLSRRQLQSQALILGVQVPKAGWSPEWDEKGPCQ